MNIGLIGKFGSGKTTAAEYLVKEYGYNRMSLADPMRKIVKDIFGVESKTDPRYRRLMQKLGTDWFRSEDKDVWVKHLLRRVEKETRPVVVDDVRFPNEAATLAARGWYIVYLDCSLEVRTQRCISRDGHFDESTLNHPSETGVDEILQMLGDGVIALPAGGSISELHEALDDLMLSLC
jgi:dephospho-CoA kinase